NEQWSTISTATTVGSQRWLPIPPTTTNRLRLTVRGMAPPALAEIALYRRPHDNFLLESRPEFDQRMAWWRNAGFGMFIHWGAYAVPAGIHQGQEISGVGEWIMNNARIPVSEYEPYAQQFNPQEFDANEWVRIAKEAGMQYIVITSKHHDGFCLWDSQVTDYDIMDTSPFRRDILAELRDACEDAGIKLCFYHSIMDWHHPDAQGKDFGNGNPQGPDFAAYRDTYLKPQLRELITRYRPHVLWFDGEWIPEWTEAQGKDLYHFVRSLDPEIIVNNRVGKGRQGMQGMNQEGDDVGDFGTPEQEILAHGSATIDWESCMTMNDSWGFKASDNNWKSPETLIHNLVDIAAKGGNYLLNVGPTAAGHIPPASVERLQEMGLWMQTNAALIQQSSTWPQFREGNDIRYIRGATGEVYAVSLRWPGEKLQLRYVHPKAGSRITLIGQPETLAWTYDAQEGLTITLPAAWQDPANRPGKYAWAFRMEADFPTVTSAPTVVRQGKTIEGLAIFTDTTTITLQGPEGSSLYYTLDGTTPSVNGLRYQGPVSITTHTTLKALAVTPGQVNSPVTQVELRRSRFNAITLKYPYAEQYQGGGLLGLVDGLEGSTNFRDGRWQGFEGHDFSATIDLGKVTTVQHLEVSFLQDIGSWIFPPRALTFSISEDGQTFTPLQVLTLPAPQATDPTGRMTFPYHGAVQGRYVRITASNIGICPPWHAGSGGKAWLFVDEIKIE
ncbi:MAG: alpha-L-fucosidase, partial [Lewinellaceae bacterium]|nr:alpha-L-fucosidase [Lewinellaceae bacterium]